VQRNPTKSGVGSTQPKKAKWPRIESTPKFLLLTQFNNETSACKPNPDKPELKIEDRIMNDECRIKEFYLFISPPSSKKKLHWNQNKFNNGNL